MSRRGLGALRWCGCRTLVDGDVDPDVTQVSERSAARRRFENCTGSQSTVPSHTLDAARRHRPQIIAETPETSGRELSPGAPQHEHTSRRRASSCLGSSAATSTHGPTWARFSATHTRQIRNGGVEPRSSALGSEEKLQIEHGPGGSRRRNRRPLMRPLIPTTSSPPRHPASHPSTRRPAAPRPHSVSDHDRTGPSLSSCRCPPQTRRRRTHTPQSLPPGRQTR